MRGRRRGWRIFMHVLCAYYSVTLLSIVKHMESNHKSSKRSPSERLNSCQSVHCLAGQNECCSRTTAQSLSLPRSGINFPPSYIHCLTELVSSKNLKMRTCCPLQLLRALPVMTDLVFNVKADQPHNAGPQRRSYRIDRAPRHGAVCGPRCSAMSSGGFP